ncbi:MAG: ferritin family protein [Syntrophaceae bacterium]|nr:ferritin family protein [Syntrophaceae bacterium]
MLEGDKRKRALEEAIRFEMDGREFFLKAAEKAKSYFAKLIFETIAEEELGHIKRVEDIYHRSATSENQTSSSTSPKVNLENVFQQAKTKIDPSLIIQADELEAIRLGIQLEIKGHEFYKRLAEETSNEFEKTFYHQLAQEESHHFSILHQVEETIVKSGSFG